MKYISSHGYVRTTNIYLSGSQPEFVTHIIRSLSFEETYIISVRVVHVTYWDYGCSISLEGEYSDSVLATTIETGNVTKTLLQY